MDFSFAQGCAFLTYRYLSVRLVKMFDTNSLERRDARFPLKFRLRIKAQETLCFLLFNIVLPKEIIVIPRILRLSDS